MSLMESPDGGDDSEEHQPQDPPPPATPTQQDDDDDYIPNQRLGVFQNIYDMTERGATREYDPAEDPGLMTETGMQMPVGPARRDECLQEGSRARGSDSNEPTGVASARKQIAA